MSNGHYVAAVRQMMHVLDNDRAGGGANHRQGSHDLYLPAIRMLAGPSRNKNSRPGETVLGCTSCACVRSCVRDDTRMHGEIPPISRFRSVATVAISRSSSPPLAKVQKVERQLRLYRRCLLFQNYGVNLPDLFISDDTTATMMVMYTVKHQHQKTVRRLLICIQSVAGQAAPAWLCS